MEKKVMTRNELAERYACKYADTKYGHNKVLNAFCAGFDACKGSLWKDAQGEDLPEIDKEVIALISIEGYFQIPPDEPIDLSYKVVFAHRPPEYWDGTNILTGEVTRHYPKRYGKGGWNIEGVKYWLDAEIPNNDE